MTIEGGINEERQQDYNFLKNAEYNSYKFPFPLRSPIKLGCMLPSTEETDKEELLLLNNNLENNDGELQNEKEEMSSLPNDELTFELEAFMSSINVSSETPSTIPSTAKRKITHLPGFLFPDGQAQAIHPEGKETVATETMAATKSPSPSVTSLGESIFKFGTGDEECERLTSKDFATSFEVLNLPVDSDEEDIKKAFKKLSLLVHPDKCKHSRAKEAFHVVNKAYEDLQRPEMKERYRAVFDEAKRRVLFDLNNKNKLRIKTKEPPLPTDDESIKQAVTTVCEELVVEMKENAEYAERCRKANEEWEKKQEEEIQKEEEQVKEQKRRWDETRDGRVEDWREFKEDIETKRFKTAAFVPVAHRREQRKPGDKTVPGKPKGIDESYKQNWR